MQKRRPKNKFCLLFYKIYELKTEKEEDVFLERNSCLFGDFKIKYAIQSYFLIMDLIRASLVSIIIVLLKKYPFICAIANCGILGVYFLIFVVLFPIKNIVKMII